MTFFLHPTVIRAVAAVSVAAVMAGCASMATSPEAVVRERATQSWKALLANDFDRAYEFMPPSYRVITPLPAYKKIFGGAVQWVSAEVVSVKCPTADKCDAHMKVEAKALVLPNRRAAPPILNYFDQTWVRENGQWWLFPTP